MERTKKRRREEEEENEDRKKTKLGKSKKTKKSEDNEARDEFKEMVDAAENLEGFLLAPAATSESDSDSSLYDKYIVKSDSSDSDFDDLTKLRRLEISNLPNAARKSDVVKFFKDIAKVTIEKLAYEDETMETKSAIVKFAFNRLAKRALKLNGKLIHVRKKNRHISRLANKALKVKWKLIHVIKNSVHIHRHVYLSHVGNGKETIFVTGYKTKVRDEIKTLLEKIFNSFSAQILHIFLTEDLSCAYLLVEHKDWEAYDKVIDSGYIDWEGVKITIRQSIMKKEFLMAEWNVNKFKKKKKKDEEEEDS